MPTCQLPPGRAHHAIRIVIRHSQPSVSLSMLLLQLMAAGCADAVIPLGDRDPPSYHFGPAEAVTELSDPAKTDNPSLTADLREIFFTSERGGGPAEIWSATREDAKDRFGAPALVTPLNSPVIETSPVISADGLTLWLASDRPGGLGDLDIWVATRSARTARWSAPANLTALNSAAKEIPRAPGQHQLIMPLSSDRDERNYYAIFFAAREAAASPFGSPKRVAELTEPTVSIVDGFLTDDGTTLFFVRGPAFGPADLFVTARRSTNDRFGEPVPLEDLNTSNDERDPWLSADGKLLFFSSDRAGRYEIYVAEVRRDPP
jgi:hypothetical protein